jgi:choline dehydrogenase-like flavoprotein
VTRRTVEADVVVIGSGAGGGTVAQSLVPLVRDGGRVVVLERGPRLALEEFTSDELQMAPRLYAQSGGFLTSQGTLTLAFGRLFGGSTVVYTGTSLPVPERVIRSWDVPGLDHSDLMERTSRFQRENNVHLLPPEEINENNSLFVRGCEAAGYRAEQFPVNLKGCLGSSLCNLGCPNGAKQGTHAVQLPRAMEGGVEVVTRAKAIRVVPPGGDDGRASVVVGVSRKAPGDVGEASAWEAGEYEVRARTVVVAGGPTGSVPLMKHSGLGSALPRLGHGFTCHPAFILVGEHEREITNDVGHPKSYFMDRAEEEGYVLETCMYFPFITAKNMTGFGPEHSALMGAFPRLQMILVLACDSATEENRIDVDASGEPVVHYTFTDPTVEKLVRATRAAARIFFGAGAVRVHAPPADPPLLGRDESDRIDERIHARHFLPGRISVSAAHLMGGCGMGRSAADSVTDAWGRVHSMPWLRVADASLFPDSLEINPYLTVMALADRVAEGVLEDLKR